MNNLRQLALATLMHADAQRQLPTGGWGWWWVGDADRGFDRNQPGGWLFNTLAYFEESSLRALAGDGSPDTMSQQQLDGARRVIRSSVSIINCPTRRPSQPYPFNVHDIAYNASPNDDNVNVAGRTDYAISCGHRRDNETTNLPGSLDDVDGFNWSFSPRGHRLIGSGLWFTGVSFQRSEIRLHHLKDGTSKVYLIGEKYLDRNHYSTGQDAADNETWCTGFNNDSFRTAFYLPLQDAAGRASPTRFGSAHVGGWYVAFCDGSIRLLSYDIARNIHQRLADRQDGKLVSDLDF